jgi:hypothetical protein
MDAACPGYFMDSSMDLVRSPQFVNLGAIQSIGHPIMLGQEA